MPISRREPERAKPQGITPRILLLKLVEQPPTSLAGNVVTTHHMKYEEAPPTVSYDQEQPMVPSPST
jgi:hypothetical protein